MDQTGHTHPKGQQAMNRDEGSYQLIHAYDRFLNTASSRRVKNMKNWVPASSDEGFWQRSKRQVLGNNFWLHLMKLTNNNTYHIRQQQ